MAEFALGVCFKDRKLICGIPEGRTDRVNHLIWRLCRGYREGYELIGFRHVVDPYSGKMYKVTLVDGYSRDIFLASRIFSEDEREKIVYDRVDDIVHPLLENTRNRIKEFYSDYVWYSKYYSTEWGDEVRVLDTILDEINEEEDVELYNDKETEVRKGRGFIGTTIVARPDPMLDSLNPFPPHTSRSFRLIMDFRYLCLRELVDFGNKNTIYHLEGEEYPLYVVVEELKKTNPEIAKEYEPYVNNDIAMKNAEALDAMLRYYGF